MEERKGFVIEIFLGLIFIVFLILMILLFIGISSAKTTSTQSQTPSVTNSYNTNNYNTYPNNNLQRRSYEHVYYDDLEYYDPEFYDDYYEDDRHLDYNDNSRLKTSRGLFGNKINDYEVYVRNEEYMGGLFEVTFYFEDHYGQVRRNSVTKYIPARESERFFYKDISVDRYEISDWWYDVKSISKTPKQNSHYDYDDDDYVVYQKTPTRRYVYHDSNY